jgi:hypothetical protein
MLCSPWIPNDWVSADSKRRGLDGRFHMEGMWKRNTVSSGHY